MTTPTSRPVAPRTIADYRPHRLVRLAIEIAAVSADPDLPEALVVADAATQGIEIDLATAEEYVAEEAAEIYANHHH